MELDKNSIVKFLEMSRDKEFLEELAVLINQTISDIKNNENRQNFDSKFGEKGVILEYLHIEIRGTFSEVSAQFILPKQKNVLDLYCEYINNSPSDFIFRASMSDFGNLQEDADSNRSAIFHKPNFYELVSKENQELFNDIIIYLTGLCGYTFDNNPFGCSEETFEFIQKGYKLAEEMGIILNGLDGNSCIVLNDKLTFRDYEREHVILFLN